ncbi:MAG: rhodanese-like domain-containing protein [Anaerolineaceae bacterium]|nr:rhodanese-like domain-containing protein [Anaerolineaceae bacterium]
MAVLVLSACGTAAAEAAPAVDLPALAPEVSVDEAAALREEGSFILDVREPDEWTAGHIEGATLIPLGQLQNRTDEVPMDQQIVVYCRSGNRSQVGRDILLEAGFTSVTSMAGGFNDWSAAGYPFVTGE